MIIFLLVLVTLNVAYLAYAITKKRKAAPVSISQETKFFDVPDNASTVYGKLVHLEENAKAKGKSEWWDEKIDSPSTNKVSRRVKKIEHDQYLLSDLGF
jgi:hypothetical protein